MKKLLSLVLLSALAAACAARGAPVATAEPVSDPALWDGDPRLYHIIATYPLDAAARDSLRAYETDHPLNTSAALAEAADDPHAPASVRANALLLLGERRAATHLHVFRMALDDEDARVRATATAAMRDFIDLRREEALGIARVALSDPDAIVQAQALNVLGDVDPALLRRYIPRAANAELRTIATELLRLAEERGAGVPADSATGVIRRESPHGITVTFTPRRRWPDWDAATGDVTLSRGAQTIASLTDIEVVAGVVPVFFSTEARYAVYERARRIVIRDLDAGTEQVVGPGIAPRALPFTDDFVYLREPLEARTELRHQTRIRYHVVRAPFASAGETAEPHVLGTTTALTSYDQHGNYSPVRWMRVEERGGSFFLSGPGLEQFALPDPFPASGLDG